MDKKWNEKFCSILKLRIDKNKIGVFLEENNKIGMKHDKIEIKTINKNKSYILYNKSWV